MFSIPGDVFTRDIGAVMDEMDPDIKNSQLEEDKRVDPENEFFDGDQDQDAEDTEMPESTST